MLSDNLHNRLAIALADPAARDELVGHLGGYPYATHWYVDAKSGDDTNDGKSADTAFATMDAAFDVIAEGAVIHLRGPIYENLTAPTGVAGVTILGDGTGLRHGSTSNTSEGYAPAWRTASGVTDEPLLALNAQGWTISGILFAGPSAETAIEIHSDGTTTPEETMSGLRILNCRFAAGEYAITDDGGSAYVTIQGCHFDSQTTCSIECLNTNNAIPLRWRVIDNYFGGTACHIRASATQWEIKDNTFGIATGIHINLQYNSSQGSNNMITRNTFGGTYTTADYLFDSTDLALGNWVTVVSTEAPNGYTILIAGA